MSSPCPSKVPSSPFNSVLNFRDVGTTVNGLLPRSSPLLQASLLYRSARPDEASQSDRHALITTYGIRTVIDLRSRTEHIEQMKKRDANIRCASCTPPSDGAAPEPVRIPGVKYMDINLNGGAFSRAMLWKLSWVSLIKLLSLMAAGYRTEAISILGREVMVPRGLVGLGQDSLDFCQEEIRQVFYVLADQSNYPILIHCTQGKDRTGLIVLLVLLLLEVPVEAIAADYVASEGALEPEKGERLNEIGRIGLGEEFTGCPVGFVEEIKRYIDEKHDGVERYLERCGVDHEMKDRLRSKMLIR
ncbi:MAG: hypothetical protein Q9217_000298 [Psora testacea]